MAERDCWTVAEAVIQTPEANRVLMYGPPGTGKTHQALTLGLREDELTYSLTLTRDSVAAELRGMYLPSGDGGAFVWHDGPCVAAMRESNERPVRLILNELDRASEDCLSFFLSVLDVARVSRETLPTGETVHAGDGLRVFATINGDPTLLPDALRDRLSVQLHIGKAHPAAIAALPADLRDAAKGTVGHTDEARRVSIRAWFAYAALRTRLDDETAAFTVFGPQRAQTVLDSLRVSKLAPKAEAEAPVVTATEVAEVIAAARETVAAPAAPAPAPAKPKAPTYTCPSCGKSVRKLYHYSRAAEPVCGPCWAHHRDHGSLPGGAAETPKATPVVAPVAEAEPKAGEYPCDYGCGHVADSAIAKARHARYCERRPRDVA